MQVSWANLETKRQAKLYRTTNFMYGDFTEIPDGMWYAKSLQIDTFDNELGEGMEAWAYTRVYRILELKVNKPVQAITPYPFPFDTRVVDHSTPEEGLLQERPRPQGKLVAPNLPEDTLQDVLHLLE